MGFALPAELLTPLDAEAQAPTPTPTPSAAPAPSGGRAARSAVRNVVQVARNGGRSDERSAAQPAPSDGRSGARWRNQTTVVQASIKHGPPGAEFGGPVLLAVISPGSLAILLAMLAQARKAISVIAITALAGRLIKLRAAGERWEIV